MWKASPTRRRAPGVNSAIRIALLLLAFVAVAAVAAEAKAVPPHLLAFSKSLLKQVDERGARAETVKSIDLKAHCHELHGPGATLSRRRTDDKPVCIVESGRGYVQRLTHLIDVDSLCPGGKTEVAGDTLQCRRPAEPKVEEEKPATHWDCISDKSASDAAQQTLRRRSRLRSWSAQPVSLTTDVNPPWRGARAGPDTPE